MLLVSSEALSALCALTWTQLSARSASLERSRCSRASRAATSASASSVVGPELSSLHTASDSRSCKQGTRPSIGQLVHW